MRESNKVALQSPTIMTLIENVLSNPDVDVEKMSRLLDMQERVLDRQAKQEFNQAMVVAQEEMPIIEKLHKNKQTDSNYAKIEDINESIQEMLVYDRQRQEFGRLDHIAGQLVATEVHHQREEDILFPALEEKGFYGPPAVMTRDHMQFRQHKHELKHLAEQSGKIDFGEFKEQLVSIVRFIVPALRDHIFKENNISFVEYDIERSERSYKEYKRLGGIGVPLLKINGKVIRGYRPQMILASLNSN